MFDAKDKLADALAWVERGIGIQKTQPSHSYVGHELASMRRALLKKLGRKQEALDWSWEEFEKRPDSNGDDELMRYVPPSDRDAWHRKAMTAPEHGSLESLIDLWVKVKETARLAARLDRAGDREVEALTHM